MIPNDSSFITQRTALISISTEIQAKGFSDEYLLLYATPLRQIFEACFNNGANTNDDDDDDDGNGDDNETRPASASLWNPLFHSFALLFEDFDALVA